MNKKEIYKEKMESKLDEMSAEIDRLQAKARGAKADGKLELSDRIDDLQDKKKTARQKLDAFADASGDAWEDMKAGMDDAWSSLSTSIKDATSRFA